MIECITISINYSDCLEIIINHNKKFFHNWIIGTISSDKKTIQLCETHNINYILCDNEIKKNNAQFNKGAMINKVFNNLEKKEWVLHLDSDILLSHDFYQISGNTHIFDKANLYCLHRWQIHRKHDAVNYITNNVRPPSTRLYEECGIGYFQLFHTSAIKNRGYFYSENHTNAGWSDTEFKKYFGKNNSKFIEHYDCWHLGQQGINWNGRVSNTLR